MGNECGMGFRIFGPEALGFGQRVAEQGRAGFLWTVLRSYEHKLFFSLFFLFSQREWEYPRLDLNS